MARAVENIDVEIFSMLTPEQSESLQITRMIFHVVGKSDGPVMLDDVVEPGPQADFLLGRVMSVMRGSRFNFGTGSQVEASLHLCSTGTGFVAQSKVMAQRLHDGQRTRPSSKPGVLVIFELMSEIGQLWALLKFDEARSLNYRIRQREDGKRIGQFTAETNSINESKDSLQMAAIVNLEGALEASTPDQVRTLSDVRVTNRNADFSNSHYFIEFLGVRRREDSAKMTLEIFDAARKAARRYKDYLAPEVARTINTRIYEAVDRLSEFDYEQIDEFVNAVFGATAAEAPIRTEFRKQLAVKRLDGERFMLDSRLVERPRSRIIQTIEGVQVIFGAASEGFIDVSRVTDIGGEIIIRTQHALERDDLT